MSVDAIANATETALSASQLQPQTLENLKAQYEKATVAVGAAGWHGPLDIETLVGLEGQFLWAENPFSFRTITFVFDPGSIGF